MHFQPDATPLPHDVQQLQHLLQIETEQKERALAQVIILEAEIRGLKTVLATHNTVVSTADNDTAAFNGQLILVVDDQLLNLDLIEALLDDSNLTVVCKSSALAALEFIKTRMPDLILMDVQMPVMDGYTATAKIRAEHADKSPIILAMTANNSPEDEQKSLAAGMQGHLCKPIDADLLIKQLHVWLQKNTDCNSPNTPANTPPDQAHDELPGIDLAAALVRLRGNRTLLEEVLISFADKAALIIPELQHAVTTQNLDGATRILHRLKGTSANLSAVRVSPLAARLETQCKRGQLPSNAELNELEITIEQLISTAQGLNKTQVAQPSLHINVDYAAIKQCLERIGTHLNNDLGQAEDGVEALLQLCQNTPWATAAHQLRALFYQFNLRAVQELIINGFEQATV